MIPGIVAGQMRASGAAPVLWTPLNMATVPQIYLDAQDSVVTDVSGFVSEISNLGAMGSLGNFSQPGVPGSRPALLESELNGNRVLRFDGVDDFLLGAGDVQRSLMASVASGWAFTVVKKRTTDVSGVVRQCLRVPSGSSGGIRFAYDIGSSVGGDRKAVRGRRLDADPLVALTSAASDSGSYSMVLAEIRYSTREGFIYVNGELDSYNSTLVASAGNTSSTSSNDALAIGASHLGATAADMDLAAMIISNTAPSDADRQRLEGWAAHKYGLTASLPGGHPYKTVAPTV